MQFDPRESKLIAQLRKQERHWKRTRWIFLCTSALSIGAGIFLSDKLFDVIDSEGWLDGEAAMFLAVFWPKVVLW